MSDFTAQVTYATPETQILPQPQMTHPEVTGDKAQEVYRVATQLLRQGPDWVTFFREILGVDGVARRLYPKASEFANLEKTQQYAEIQQMLTSLRGKNLSNGDGKEPTRVITVRLPKSLHEALRVEAHDRKTSMNKLCIVKLLQVIEEAYEPAE